MRHSRSASDITQCFKRAKLFLRRTMHRNFCAQQQVSLIYNFGYSTGRNRTFRKEQKNHRQANDAKHYCDGVYFGFYRLFDVLRRRIGRAGRPDLITERGRSLLPRKCNAYLLSESWGDHRAIQSILIGRSRRISPSCRNCSGLIVTFMMRPRPLAQTSKPYPQTDIRRPHRTTRCERNSLSHALTNPPPSNPHHTARTH
jgi:hypothetical protein